MLVTNLAGVGLAWQWWLPYRKHFDRLMNHLIAGGIPSVWLARLQNADEILYDLKRNEEGPKVMTVEHLKGTFFIIIAGLLFALSIFIIEIARKSYGALKGFVQFQVKQQVKWKLRRSLKGVKTIGFKPRLFR